MSISFRLRITHKIAAIGVLGILGLALVAAIYFFGASSQGRYLAVGSAARSTSALTNKLFVTLLEARRAEKDFLLRNELKHVARHGELVKAIDAELAALQARAAGQAELGAKVAAIRDGFKQYV